MFIPIKKMNFELELSNFCQDQNRYSRASLQSYSTPPYRELWWFRGVIFFRRRGQSHSTTCLEFLCSYVPMFLARVCLDGVLSAKQNCALFTRYRGAWSRGD
eukprot:sb/3478350/